MIFQAWQNKSILILGFGLEGQSTLRFLRKHFPDKEIFIADRDDSLPEQHQHLEQVSWITGEKYLDNATDFDVIIKSPGVAFKEAKDSLITSQTDIFLQQFRKQVIGVTGTKGKSTTASLIHRIIQKQYPDSLLIGNIGTPPLDKYSEISSRAPIVHEISAHQLQHIHVAPHIAVFMNLFEEHLDHFGSKEQYFEAKRNILQRQNNDDRAVLNAEETLNGNLDACGNYPAHVYRFALNKGQDIHAWIENQEIIYSGEGETRHFALHDFKLPGKHNQLNAMAAVIVAKQLGIRDDLIADALSTFNGLPHRLERIAVKDGVAFYNDAISTVPETTLQALKTLPDTHTLILGGFDRGIDYSSLLKFLENADIKQLIFTGPAGKRMQKHYSGNQQTVSLDDMQDIVNHAHQNTPAGKICLLSPAAASYDRYKNFEERGNAFRKAIENI
ncbi:MAG: UDP-N-acetylmuramoyl-L-alanine--D-glutamate ligase [Bacteroidota bacterium]